VRDRILGAGLNAKSAKNAAAVINVVNLSVSLVTADAFGVRARIVLRFDVDTVRRASRGAQVTRDAFFLSGLVNVQQVLTAVSRLDRDRHIGILDRPFFTRYLRQRPAHALDHCDGRLDDITENRHK